MRAQFLAHTQDGSHRLEQEAFTLFLVQAGGGQETLPTW